MINLTDHKCKGKCSEYKGEQCKHCLVLGDDIHLDHHLSPNCRVMDSEESIHYLRALEAQREVS